jgi:hypothetical protein
MQNKVGKDDVRISGCWRSIRGQLIMQNLCMQKLYRILFTVPATEKAVFAQSLHNFFLPEDA